MVAGNPDQTPGFVDSHVHVFSPDLIERRDQLVETDNWFRELYSIRLAALTTTEELIVSMDQSQIDLSVACGFPWSDPGLCREHNDYMCWSQRKYPDRVAWLATVVPQDPGSAIEAERCFQEGAAGIGELNADGQGFDLVDPEPLRELVEVCKAYNRPIMFHVSEPVGHGYPGKGTATPDKLLTFLAHYQEVSIIAAHWGGGLPFYELMPEVAHLTRNVVYDSAATTYLYRFPVFQAAINLAGPRRVMFASDFPVLRQDRLKKRVERLSLPDDTWRLVTGENATRVFGLA